MSLMLTPNTPGTLTLTPVGAAALSLSAPASYVMFSNGTTVAAYNGAGALVATGLDGGAVLATIFGQLPAAGGSVTFRNDGNVFPWGSVPAIPRGITNKLLIQGNGATVQLSTGGPRFLDFAKVANYDTFQNIEVTDFVVDANNIGGKHHVVIGNWVGGTTTLYLNFKNIALRRIKAINVPVDSTLTNHRLGVFLASSQSAGGEATQTVIDHVIVEDCRFEGGNQGVIVVGSCTAGSSVTNLKVRVNDVTIERCWHSLLAAQTSTFTSGNYQIGSLATGGTCRVIDCYGAYSADTGVEINSMQDATVRGCVIEDAYTTNFYHTNFATPTTPNDQTIRFVGCKARKLTCTGVSDGFGMQPNNSVAINNVEVIDCAYYASEPTTSTGNGFHQAVASQRTLLDGFTVVKEGFSIASTNQFLRGVVVSYTGSTPTDLTIRDTKITITGTNSGSASGWNTAGVLLDGTINLSVENLLTSLSVSGAVATTTQAFSVGVDNTTTIEGDITRWRCVTGSDTSPSGLVLFSSPGVTISPSLTLNDCNFTGMSAGSEVAIPFANRPQVYLNAIRWRTFPKPSVGISVNTFAAASFTTANGNQYYAGYPAEIHFASGTGSGVTKIEASKDGTTYEEVYAQSSGAMAQDFVVRVDNGDYVRVTFSTTQPTVRVRPFR